jgi:amidase
MPFVIVMRSVPLIAMCPLIGLVFGRGLFGVTIIAGVVTFVPSLVTIVDGLRSAPAAATDLIHCYGGVKRSTLFKVRVPFAAPALFAAAKISMPGAVLGSVLAEWLITGRSLDRDRADPCRLAGALLRRRGDRRRRPRPGPRLVSTAAPTVEPFAAATLSPPRAPVGWPAWRLREAIVNDECSAREVAEAHLDRLDEVEPWLNAAAFTRREAALADADRVQVELDAGHPPGPLCGVPITVKDILATAGTPTCVGSRAFAANTPRFDAAAVARLRAAGAVVIAKTNCPEFAFGVTTDSVAHGVTRSPWGAHSPGGSSGGEAALVAAGASALGLGTDYGGSLRWPAQCCGVLALRPGVGAVDGTGQLPERGGRLDGGPGAPGLDSVQRQFQVVGPIARTVRDLALAMATLGGRELRAAEPQTGAGASGALACELRIGWVGGEDSQRVGPQARAALATALAALEAAGLELEEAPGSLDGLHVAFNELRDTDPLADLVAAVGDRRGLLGPAAARTLACAPVSGADPKALRIRIVELRARVLAQLERTPVLIAPLAPAAACGLDGTATVDGVVLAGFALMAQCRAVSATGLPALSIPVARDRRGLPLSVQVIGGPGGEGLVLDVGLVLERLLGGRQEPPWTGGIT